MRYTMTLAAMAVGLTAAFGQGKKATPDLKADSTALQGKWERVATTEPGVDKFRVVKEVRGDSETVTWTGEDGRVVRSHRAAVKLSEDGPVRVYTYSDLEVLAGPFQGRKSKAGGAFQYRIDGDELYEVGGMMSHPEPAKGTPHLVRWRRVNGEPKPAAVVAGDLKFLQGDWNYTAQEVDGVQIPGDVLKLLAVTFDGGTFSLKSGKDVVQDGAITLDAAATPKAIDIAVTSGREKGNTWVGIYKLDGDTLTVCFDPAGKKRPTEFLAKEGSGRFVSVFTRAKK